MGWYRELPGFNRNKAGISYYDGVGWDMTNSVVLLLSRTIPREAVQLISPAEEFCSRNKTCIDGITCCTKTYLQGPYAGAGLMGDNLRALSLIPLTEPIH